ncbi:DegV family protein with EDD domain [Lactobacillus colini]|uniref:DegV family protein with EDD domain n=1 Tax=Lactobacillus colini TaxID=1819254 RepID=A0ABS4MCY5_9LACO|nr:DegV family protein [Lactobacillus colini]MBP2057549.1 DegV family protein with EDD domain [Lactobacillus colini]
MTIKIITDSGANTFENTILNIQHTNVPLTIRAGSKSWTDNEELDLNSFVEELANTKEKTSSACPSINDWLSAYEGADEIYVLTITSGLSGTYNSAVQAANLFKEDHPDVKIHIFDTKTAGPQIRLLSKKTAELINLDKSFDEVVETINQEINKTNLLFVLEHLDNLANNGRISPAIAKVTHLLKLNIYGSANSEGKFEMLGKTRGGKKMYPKLLKVMQAAGYHGGEVMIDTVDADGKAQLLKTEILSVYPEAEVTISTCGGLCSYYAENNGIMIGYEI